MEFKDLKTAKTFLKKASFSELSKLTRIELNFLLKVSGKYKAEYRLLTNNDKALLLSRTESDKVYISISKKAKIKAEEVNKKISAPLIKAAKERKEKAKSLNSLLK